MAAKKRVRKGRPKVHGDRVQLSVRLPEALHERLRAAAYHRHESINDVLCRALESWLNTVWRDHWREGP